MKLWTSDRCLRADKAPVSRRRAAFTLLEVLAALAFMAIVIPVAVEGLRVASLAGRVGQRKVAAARVAERVLNEWLVNSQAQSGAQNGVIQDGQEEYSWSLHVEPWNQDTMRLVTVEVQYTVQGQSYDVRVNTLLSNSSI